ncbi:MAG: NAD(P)-dependent oxidoreductase [Actinomycetaceae bacterium]|nr:hypothetical protein [Arcanobacterium sp.]MDD7505019.1 NAD(P)-dependent oxidoreductase [Actinomycetaceae bacterium]MDY6143734.1 NAD(P)-dependent oxidoreductase [Arcanobacterium sp.]
MALAVPQRVLITESAVRELQAILRDELKGEAPETRFVPFKELTEADLRWADSWVGFRPPAGPLRSGIRWYHAATDGVDAFHVFGDEFAQTDAILTNTVGSMPRRIAQYVLGHVLAHGLKVREYLRLQEHSRWQKLEALPLDAMKVTVIGTGHIGQAIARVLRPFSSEIRGLSASGQRKRGFDDTASLASRKYLEDADVVVAVLPHTPESERVIDHAIVEAMHGAVFVNVGRGTTVDPDALREGLSQGNIETAILDVFETEPLPAGDWRWAHPKVTVTPHVSGVTLLDDITGDFIANYRALYVEQTPPNRIDLRRGY